MQVAPEALPDITCRPYAALQKLCDYVNMLGLKQRHRAFARAPVIAL